MECYECGNDVEDYRKITNLEGLDAFLCEECFPHLRNMLEIVQCPRCGRWFWWEDVDTKDFCPECR